jgi:hypothetical protein
LVVVASTEIVALLSPSSEVYGPTVPVQVEVPDWFLIGLVVALPFMRIISSTLASLLGAVTLTVTLLDVGIVVPQLLPHVVVIWSYSIGFAGTVIIGVDWVDITVGGEVGT